MSRSVPYLPVLLFTNRVFFLEKPCDQTTLLNNTTIDSIFDKSTTFDKGTIFDYTITKRGAFLSR